MKFVVSIILIALLSFISCIYFPWYCIAFFAFLINIIIPHSPLKAFFSGFIALFVLWVALSGWIDTANDGILSTRIAQLLPLAGSRILLVLITGLIGGLVAGLAALSASFLKKV